MVRIRIDVFRLGSFCVFAVLRFWVPVVELVGRLVLAVASVHPVPGPRGTYRSSSHGAFLLPAPLTLMTLTPVAGQDGCGGEPAEGTAGRGSGVVAGAHSTSGGRVARGVLAGGEGGERHGDGRDV
jgi:hypothetical protein